jgi:hypothetical protein
MIEYQKLLKARDKKNAKEVSQSIAKDLTALGLPLEGEEDEEPVDPYDAMRELVERFRRAKKEKSSSV